MRNYNYIFFLFFIYLGINAQSQINIQPEKSAFIKDYKKTWKIMSENQNYSFKMRYLSFSDHKTKLATETASGFYTKSGNNYLCNIMGIKTVQNSIVKVSIDSIDKLIIITNPDKIELPMTNTNRVEELIDNSKKVSRKAEKGFIIYKIDFNPNDLYESFELKIKDNGVPLQMTFFYSALIDKDYEESIQGKESALSPRLEIHFEDFKEFSKINELDFSEKLYVLIENKIVKKTEKYKSYTLKDYRIQK